MRYLVCVLTMLLTFSSIPKLGGEQALQVSKASGSSGTEQKVPTVEDAIRSKTDLWGEMAMRQPGGPSYEFFAELLPPLRYVDAGFHHYPIVLSAPSGSVKARLISNGSAVNALARQLNWRSEIGVPVKFYVGDYGVVFGSDLSNLDGPHYLKGYLPIIQNRYRDHDSVVTQEVFGSVDSPYKESATVFVRFTGTGQIVAQLSLSTNDRLPVADGVVRDAQGGALLWFDGNWKWEPGGQKLIAALSPECPALLAIFTQPLKGSLPSLSEAVYDAQRSRCIETWESLLSRGMQVETPEAVVNNAWRSLIVGTFELVCGDEMRYSAGNQYAKMYVGEGGDAIRSVLLWGFGQDARRTIVPLMDYKRAGLLFHQAGKKLQMLSHYYWLTRDADFFKEQRERWTLQVNRVVEGREPESGLFPRERYCGDIGTPVYSLNSNAAAWRGLRDFAAVLDELGEEDEAARLMKVANEFRPVILAAAEKSVRHDVDPPFVPIALFGEEEPYDPLTGTRLGGYWDLMAPYVLGSGVFEYDSETTKWILDYLQQKGGLMMGMVRTHPASSFWVVKQNIDDLYTLRYVLRLLQRDEVDRALVSFYGKLAQGLTRDTFIGAEGTNPMPLDDFGRQMYLPPNSAGNAFFLWMLRYLLVQDWDMDDDGRPDTLRLLFATPRRWLEDGKCIKVERAPTGFGEVSVSVESRLKKGEVLAEVTAPPRTPKHALIRARVPEGWKVVSADVGGTKVSVDGSGAADITGMEGRFTVSFEVRK